MSDSILQKWQVIASPLVLDAFTVHMWATPFTRYLLNIAADPRSGSHFFTVATVLLVAALTFTVSRTAIKHAGLLHEATSVSDSPLFRVAWLFAATVTVAHSVGAGVPVFTLLTFVPVVYVRVPSVIPAVSAVYATVYFLCTLVGTLNRAVPVVPHVNGQIEQGVSYFAIACVWLSFVLSCAHHAAWIASHNHPDQPGVAASSKSGDTESPPISPIRWLYEQVFDESVQLAAYRTGVVLACTFLHDAGRETGHVAFLQKLSLLVTISTFESFTHCQHEGTNTLTSILLATVVVVTFGMLVGNVEQTACILLVTPAAIAFELASVRRLSRKRLEEGRGSVKEL